MPSVLTDKLIGDCVCLLAHIAMAAAAVAVTATTEAGRRVLEGKLGSGDAGHTLLFAGSAVTQGRGAVDEELHIQGSRC